MSRRGFLGVVVAGAAAAAVGCSSDDDTTSPGGGAPGTTSGSTADAAIPDLGGDPFALGVASGDPLDDSVILWTRLAVEPVTPAGDGAVPAEPVLLRWEVATDDSFGEIVASGDAVAEPALGHSVHVDAAGLEPDTWYAYRFVVGEHTSPVGRTRTLPAPDADVDRFAFAFGSCQHYESGYWTAYDHLVDEDIDLFVFLGDYIYENGVGSDGVRQHDGPEIFTLADYRNRYGLYKSDASLRAAHAAVPWVATWDDHEVDNNYADDVHEGGDPPEEFLERRAAAYQAYYEHLPIRLDPPAGADLPIYRSLAIGQLADLFVIDTRQYRDDQVCPGEEGLPAAARCDDALDPDRTMLGEEQRTWLTDGLRGSSASWAVLANQVVFSDMPIAGAFYNMDQWDGYVADRELVLAAMADSAATPIVVTGDIHLAGAAELRTDWSDPDAETIGVELVGTSISSQFPTEFAPVVEQVAETVDHVRYVNASQRGYCVVRLSPDEATATYRVVATTAEPTSDVATDATFTIANDAPGLVAG